MEDKVWLMVKVVKDIPAGFGEDGFRKEEIAFVANHYDRVILYNDNERIGSLPKLDARHHLEYVTTKDGHYIQHKDNDEIYERYCDRWNTKIWR